MVCITGDGFMCDCNVLCPYFALPHLFTSKGCCQLRYILVRSTLVLHALADMQLLRSWQPGVQPLTMQTVTGGKDLVSVVLLGRKAGRSG